MPVQLAANHRHGLANAEPSGWNHGRQRRVDRSKLHGLARRRVVAQPLHRPHCDTLTTSQHVADHCQVVFVEARLLHRLPTPRNRHDLRPENGIKSREAPFAVLLRQSIGQCWHVDEDCDANHAGEEPSSTQFPRNREHRLWAWGSLPFGSWDRLAFHPMSGHLPSAELRRNTQRHLAAEPPEVSAADPRIGPGQIEQKRFVWLLITNHQEHTQALGLRLRQPRYAHHRAAANPLVPQHLPRLVSEARKLEVLGPVRVLAQGSCEVFQQLAELPGRRVHQTIVGRLVL